MFKTLLSDIILYLSFTSSLGLVISTTLHLYCTLNTTPIYSRSTVILTQFIIFNSLVDSDYGLAYVHQVSSSKTLHKLPSSSIIYLTHYL